MKQVEKAKLKIAKTLSVRDAFKNEEGAIDLASIMVGIIVIGLIGGVIAATVFTVIPWAQDNAAKQQLESIHSAQNAFFGLSSDPSRALTAGQKVNSFGDSAALSAAGLMQTGNTYCTTTLSSGKDYIVFAKSGSNKVFAAKNSSKTASIADTTFPCVDGVFKSELLSSSYASTLPDLDGAAVTPPASPPVYTQIALYDFNTSIPTNFTTNSASESLDRLAGFNGTAPLREYTSNYAGATSLKYTNGSYTPGQKYRITFKAKIAHNGTTQTLKATSTSGATAYTSNTLTKPTTSVDLIDVVTLDFTPSTDTQIVYINATGVTPTSAPLILIDDFKVEKVD